MAAEERIADYFVVAGLPPENPQPIEQFSNETTTKLQDTQHPIVDIAVIIRTQGETAPAGYTVVETTPGGLVADLNHGSVRAPQVLICYRRGRDKPPLMDIGVLYEGKETLMHGCEIVQKTAHYRPANVNNSNSNRTFLTFRRADDTAAPDVLGRHCTCCMLFISLKAVTDICVIVSSKGEAPPHTFHKIDKNLNRGMVGSDVYLCYKKSMTNANMLTYKPEVLSRYPEADLPEFPLPSVPMFCLPLGASVEVWPERAQHPLPKYSTFVLTTEQGVKVYGAAVMFYEEMQKDDLTDEQKSLLGLDPDENKRPSDVMTPTDSPASKSPTRSPLVSPSRSISQAVTIHQSKCLSLISRWPFFDTFRRFLMYIYKMSVHGRHVLPIERYVQHLLEEVPFPCAVRPRIEAELEHETVCISAPEELPLPLSGASYTTLLRNLGAENCINLLVYALSEHQILIHSLRPDVLTSVAEALTTIIFPFHWQCPYVPLLPLTLSDMLNAPMPFIAGVDSRFFDMYEPPPEVTCVDLDTNTVYVPDERKQSSKLYPRKPAKALRNTLDKLYEALMREPDNGHVVDLTFDSGGTADAVFARRRRMMKMELAIQEAFLRFMATLLKGYSAFLMPIISAPKSLDTDVGSRFNVNDFLKSREKTHQKFFQLIVKTQMFSRFIEERSFVSDKDASLVFFDEILAKLDDSDARLLEVDDVGKNDRTVFLPPPEPVGLEPGKEFIYNGFPDLDHGLFLHKARPSILAALKTPQPCPNSPMTRRTKQELRSAQKTAQKNAANPQRWARCLLGHCYALWFIHLPAYVQVARNSAKALRQAHDVLERIQHSRLEVSDEVCYRVMLQLCGIHQQPSLAVKVLYQMKEQGIQPNAITYGAYNKALLESRWPSALARWTLLKNVVRAVTLFKQALKPNRRTSVYSSDSQSELDAISRHSAESASLLDADKNAAVSGSSGAAQATSKQTGPVAKATDSPSNEERTSTGGSDRGYSSMTMEDSKRNSAVIGSQESIESLTRVPDKREVKSQPRNVRKILKFEKKEKSPKRTTANSLCDDTPLPRIDTTPKNTTSSMSDASPLSDCSSPSQATRTPVTEADPLGVFTTADVITDPLTAASGESGDAKAATNQLAADHAKNPLVDMQPFSDPKFKTKPSGGDTSPSKERKWKRKSRGEGDSPAKEVETPRRRGRLIPRTESLRSAISATTGFLAKKYSEFRTPSKEVKVETHEVLEEEETTDSIGTENTCDTESVDSEDILERKRSTPWVTQMRYTLEYLQSLSGLQGFTQTALQSWHSLAAKSVESLRSTTSQGSNYGADLPRLEMDQLSVSSRDSQMRISGSVQSLPGLSYCTAVEVEICTLSRCNACSSLLYDEEIMAGWSADDSNLNTTCPFCTSQLVPNLSITVKDYRPCTEPQLRPSQSQESILSSGGATQIGRLNARGGTNRSLNSLLTADGQPPEVTDPRLKLLLSRVDGADEELNSSTNQSTHRKTSLPGNGLLFDDVMEGVQNATVEPVPRTTSVDIVDVVEQSENATDAEVKEEVETQISLNPDSSKSTPNETELLDASAEENNPLAVPENQNTSETEHSDKTQPSTGSDPLTSPEQPINETEPASVDKTLTSNSTPEKEEAHNETLEASNTSSPEAEQKDDSMSPDRNILKRLLSSPARTVLGPGDADPLRQQSSHDRLQVDLKARRASAGAHSMQFSVPYLSPLVLRKEIETVLQDEADRCLATATFLDKHPIIYWNLLWYFKRMDIVSHLPGHVLTAESTNQNGAPPRGWDGADHRHVTVRTLWDLPSMQNLEIGLPMYTRYNTGSGGIGNKTKEDLVLANQSFSKSLMQKIVSHIMASEVTDPLRMILLERNRQRRENAKGHFRSMYRDILFLSLVSLGPENIDQDAFDREYKAALDALNPREYGKAHVFDKAPTNSAIWCRRLFHRLDLPT